MQKRLDNDQFLATVAKLFATAESQGSVYLEQKRLTRTGADSSLDATASPYPLLFRATDGVGDKKTRISVSTVVAAGDLDTFWQKYIDALKSGMGGLRRKDKKKQRK